MTGRVLVDDAERALAVDPHLDQVAVVLARTRQGLAPRRRQSI